MEDMKDFLGFLFTDLLPKLLVVFIIIGLILSCISGTAYVLWRNGALPAVENSLNIYERLYSECMSRETIEHEECHDIAVRQAYPED